MFEYFILKYVCTVLMQKFHWLREHAFETAQTFGTLALFTEQNLEAFIKRVKDAVKVNRIIPDAIVRAHQSRFSCELSNTFSKKHQLRLTG